MEPKPLDYAQPTTSKRPKKLLGVLVGIAIGMPIGLLLIWALEMAAFWFRRHQ